MSAGLAGPVAAQGGPITGPPPVHSFVDNNGVDLTSGYLTVTTPGLTIGQGEGALSYVRELINTGWTDNVIGTVNVNGSTVTVSFGGTSDTFTLSGGTYTNALGLGSTLTNSGGYYTYTSHTGVVVQFQQSLAGYLPCYGNGGRPVSVTWPDGKVLTYTYNTISVSGTNTCSSGSTTSAARVQSVTNNFGYQLHFTYQVDTASTVAGLTAWTTVAQVTAINNAVDYCSPSANECTGLTVTWPTLTYATNTGPYVTISVTDALSHVSQYVYNASNQLAGIIPPGATSPTSSIAYNSSSQVTSVSNSAKIIGPSGQGPGSWTYSYSIAGGNLTTTVLDPLGNSRSVVSATGSGLPASDTDALGDQTQYSYDSYGRLQIFTYPEGNTVTYAYDGRGNINTTTVRAPAGHPGTPIVTSAGFDTTCVYPAKCNQPNSTTDANGNQTNYTYDNTHGTVLTITGPPPTSGAVAPVQTFGYTQLYAWYKNSGGSIVQASTSVDLLTSISQCATTASCSGTSDQVISSLTYGTAGVANNLGLTATASGSGVTPSMTTSSLAYDNFGNVVTVVGPLGSTQTTTLFYDADRNTSGVIGPLPSGSSSYPATRYTYNAGNQLTLAEQGTTTSQASLTSFSSMIQQATAYDIVGRQVQTSVASGGTTQSLTQYAYDNANRLTCTAVRMNASAFASPPASACILGSLGSNGPDRITLNGYDQANRLTSVTTGYLSPNQITYATTTYAANGEVLTVKDGANNLTTFIYDYYDRLSQVEFPLPTTGSDASNTSDYESYGYDNNGNLTSKRLRSGQSVTLTYDALNRLTQEQFPSGTSLPVYYGYDLLNRVLMASNSSPTGPGVAYVYDALSRVTSMTQNSKTLSYGYDAAGNRTTITWPDTSNPLTATYVYDPLNHVTQIEQNGATSGTGLLATYAYDSLGRRTGISRAGGAGMSTSYGYDTVSRLGTLTQTLASSAGTTFTLGYNPANQVISRADSNGAFTVAPAAVSLTYTANGLNQYSSITGGTQALTGAPQGTLTYDPEGRIQSVTTSGTTSNFLYDGAFLAEEYNTSGTTTARYVPGPGTDEPLTVYSGASLSYPNWYAADQEGSIIATANSSGTEVASFAYGPYGEPLTSAGAPSWAGARYRYTGQIVIAGAQTYFYKARMYDPVTGRFIQTDPAGFGGGINIYAYVMNDPINGWDPTGLTPQGSCQDSQACQLIKCTGGTTCLGGITVMGFQGPTQAQLDLIAFLLTRGFLVNGSKGDAGKASTSKLGPCAQTVAQNVLAQNGYPTSQIPSITIHNGPDSGTDALRDAAFSSGADAYTEGNDIYLTPGADSRTVFEEVAHTAQFRKYGTLGFYALYAFGAIDAADNGNDSYWQNPIETDAKSMAATMNKAYNATCGHN